MQDSQRGMDLLIVDDDQEVRRLLTLVLEQAGYRVETARNGCEALASVAHAPPALVLLDLAMPVMTGREFVRRLRTPGIHIPVIAMSGGVETKADAVSFGASGYLPKPFDIEAVLEMVRHFVPYTAAAPDNPSRFFD